MAYRSHYAFINNPLQTSGGRDTSATFGYVRDLLLILKEFEPDCVAVAFDVSRKTFRTEMYEEYKATRAKAPAELTDQPERFSSGPSTRSRCLRSSGPSSSPATRRSTSGSGA